jgi:DNA repair protein RecN (Recombination protein N)
MLQQLIITNFALIENICIEPEPGLNVLSGETGAGKTILIGALGVLRGNRAQTEYIRKGEESASVEGFFFFHELLPSVPELGLDLEGEEGILLRRKISIKGKNKCYINGKMVPLNLYADLAKSLLDIHGQNQEQSLLKSDRQLQLVDRYGKQEIASLLVGVSKSFLERKDLKRAMKELELESAEAAREIDFLNFQIEEIEQKKLVLGEEEELRAESKYLSNLDEINTRARETYSLLQEQNQVLDKIDAASRELEKITEYDELFKGAAETLQSAYYGLEETARDLNGYLQKMEYDDNRLDLVESRIGEINFLKKKYGTSIEEILIFQQEAKDRLVRYSNKDETLLELKTRHQDTNDEYQNLCAKLRDARMRAGGALGIRITELLRKLSMKNAELTVGTEAANETVSGFDKVVFSFSPNVGEGARPLAKIASGGEISRIMLAIKTILSREDEIDILVFDEVDTGVGGESLLAVAKNLSVLAKNKQVFCVTHSPQLAAFADCHFRIEKNVENGRTKTLIEKLGEEQRQSEIHRMLGGAEIAGTAEQARLLIHSAKRMKNQDDA